MSGGWLRRALRGSLQGVRRGRARTAFSEEAGRIGARTEEDLLVLELMAALGAAIGGMRVGREIAYESFTCRGSREVSEKQANVIRAQDHVTGLCERSLARGEAWLEARRKCVSAK